MTLKNKIFGIISILTGIVLFLLAASTLINLLATEVQISLLRGSIDNQIENSIHSAYMNIKLFNWASIIIETITGLLWVLMGYIVLRYKDENTKKRSFLGSTSLLRKDLH